MFNTDFVTVQHLRQMRARDQRRSERDIILATREQMPAETQADLMRDLRQWMRTRSQKQEVSDVRRAHAI